MLGERETNARPAEWVAKQGGMSMRKWSKPLSAMQPGDIVEAIYYLWNPLSRWMLGSWEESGRQQFRVITVLDLFDRDYPSKLENLRHQHGDIEAIAYERRIVVLTPVGPFVPKE
jgi:hypothetical protein